MLGWIPNNKHVDEVTKSPVNKYRYSYTESRGPKNIPQEQHPKAVEKRMEKYHGEIINNRSPMNTYYNTNHHLYAISATLNYVKHHHKVQRIYLQTADRLLGHSKCFRFIQI